MRYVAAVVAVLVTALGAPSAAAQEASPSFVSGRSSIARDGSLVATFREKGLTRNVPVHYRLQAFGYAEYHCGTVFWGNINWGGPSWDTPSQPPGRRGNRRAWGPSR